jgi:hypothetical protein
VTRASAVGAALVLAGVSCTPGVWGFCRTTTARVRPSMLGECVSMGVPLQWKNRCTSYSVYNGRTPADIPAATFAMIARGGADAWARVPCNAEGGGMPYYRVLPLGGTWNPTGYDARGTNSNTLSFRFRWEDDATHRAGTIAITVVTFDALTGEIFDADIEFNTREPTQNPNGFVFSTARLSDMGSADLQTIMTHELGHFLGLAHSDNDRAVMWPEAGLGEVRRDLTADDSAGLCDIYPERSAPDERCNSTPYGGLATLPGGPRVIGTCALTPTRTPCGALGTLALGWAGRRRRRRA